MEGCVPRSEKSNFVLVLYEYEYYRHTIARILLPFTEGISPTYPPEFDCHRILDLGWY
jgi:hypothetical protein